MPTEGAVVIDGDGAPAGQVTSARYSPVLDRVIGMAWVPAALASDGVADHDLRPGPHDRRREVQTRPFYDPDGEVLRS